MPSTLFYILKLSVALAAVYLFYQLVLRRLTFYNWNRWYLLGYTILAFLIPFINITPILENNEWSDVRIINWVPIINEDTTVQSIPDNNASITFSPGNIMLMILISGVLFLFVRLIIQFVSFNRMKKKATPFTENGLTIYQVNENIIPFSFGNSIFINKQLHNEEDLSEIIRHEIIHVKQKHSVDIIWGELLCLLNWYNPFAWLLKRSIRQNLEFIADNKVVQNGINKKEYQYLLLKVIGNCQYSIATQFNFSSLKKRIVMMNKTKSAKRQLLRMLFLLPATAILLLAFRNKLRESNGASAKSERLNNTLPISNIAIKQPGIISDTIPGKNLPKDYKEFLKRNPQIENLQWSGDPFSMTINLKNGSKETYNLENKKEIAGLEKKYGKLPAAPSLLPGSVKEIVVTGKPLSEVGELDEVKGVTVTEVPIKVVTADLSEVVVTGKSLTKTVPASTDLKAVAVAGKSLNTTVAASTDLKEVAITGMRITADISTPVKINPGVSVIAPIDLSRSAIALDEEILVTISKNSTRQQLEEFKQQAKQKGGELTFEDVAYNDKGILTNISGTITSKDGRSNFSASDFENLILLLIRDGDSTYFKVKINGDKSSIRTSGKKTRLS
ncbi:MAG TPA: M56 family metallopeptidase [Chitinophagaceae bacterium]|nr:M56 family metallopeptidase [Chitinophagaceae bacterium]